MSRKTKTHPDSGLTRGGPSLVPALVPSMALHLGLFGLLTAVGTCGSSRPPLLDKDIYMVSAVALPKAESLPDKAAAPRQRQPTPSKIKSPKPAPAPDNSMLLKVKEDEKPKADKKPEADKKPKKTPPPPDKEGPSREKLLAQLDDTADQLRFETSVEGDPDADPAEGLKARFARPLTAYERQVHDQVKSNWFPKYMGGQADPKLWTVVSFEIDGNGAILSPYTEKSSGDRVFDMSALRAVIRTRRVPPPAADAARSFSIGFSPKDSS